MKMSSEFSEKKKKKKKKCVHTSLSCIKTKVVIKCLKKNFFLFFSAKNQLGGERVKVIIKMIHYLLTNSRK